MIKSSWLVLCVSVSMVGSMTNAQTLFNPRAIALGAYSASVNDIRGFDINPSGIVGIRDWDFSTATYAFTSGSSGGFVFQGMSFGKHFLEDNAVAVQYSPGTSLEFLLPTNPIHSTSGPVSFDKRIKYEERFALGYARKFSDLFAVGVGVRSREATVTDAQYQLDTVIVVSYNEYNSRSWHVDLGLTWKPSSNLTFSAVGRSIATIEEDELPSEFQTFDLSNKAMLELGAAYGLTRTLRVAADVSTEKSGAVGYEWIPAYRIAVRSGLYWSTSESPFIYAVAAGLGWSYEFLQVDASYMHFFDQVNRKGSGALSEFDPTSIKRIDVNPYTHDRVSLSLKAVFGNVRESLARIESVEMLAGVYPSSYEALAYRPIGKVRVKNVSEKPIEARASFYVDKLMDSPTESKPVYITPGSEEEIPLTAVFNEQMKSFSQMTIRDGNVYISATPAEEYDDKYQTRVLIHGKNDWDGDVSSLRYFVMPNDPDVIRYGRDILLQAKDSLEDVPVELQPYRKARVLFDAFAGKLMYVNDPKQSGDYVQYPPETLTLRGGDCDDMTVTFSSLLNSIGVSTAFVDVIPPERPEKSHIYLLFDTGLDPKYGSNISVNPKRFVVRKNKNGTETIWLPIETTVITRGFDEAWTSGAQKYFDDVELGLGLIKGWVRIVDVY
jgi:hypothetical protein